jgi:hypothetical protein
MLGELDDVIFKDFDWLLTMPCHRLTNENTNRQLEIRYLLIFINTVAA